MTSVPLAELMERNTRSRFAVLETASKHPGKCAVCGAPNKPVLDLGLNIPMYGFVMLCFECVTEAGQRIGLVLAEELNETALQAGQSVEDYLAQRNLKVISNELYESLFVVVGMFTADAVHIPGNLPDSVDSQDSEKSPTLFELGQSADESGDPAPSGNSEPFNFPTS